jgi:hypothetical protein
MSSTEIQMLMYHQTLQSRYTTATFPAVTGTLSEQISVLGTRSVTLPKARIYNGRMHS